MNDAGDACAEGELGQVVVTPLHNFAMPLIRYAIGDYAQVGGPCACGRTLPTLARIAGRDRARLVMPSGERRFAYNPTEAFLRHPGIRQYQIVQNVGGEIELRLVASEPLRETAQKDLTDRLAIAFGHPFAVRFSYVDNIPRGPGGKFHDIICEIPD